MAAVSVLELTIARYITTAAALTALLVESVAAVPRFLPVDSLVSRRADLSGELARGGWLWPRFTVESIDLDDAQQVRVIIDSGPVARIAAWKFDGNTILTESQLRAGLPKRGLRFTLAVLEQGLDNVTNMYAEEGRPFAVVHAMSLTDSMSFVTLRLGINEGPVARVSGVVFDGNDLPSASVLARVIRFRPAAASRRYIDYWTRRLEISGWVRVDSHRLMAQENLTAETVSCRLKYWLRPLRVNEVLAMVGYSAQDKVVVGFGLVTLGNLFGTGRRFNATWQSGNRQMTLTATYVEPWIFGTDFSLRFGVSHHSLSTIGSWTRIEGGAQCPVARDIDVGAFASVERSATTVGLAATTVSLGSLFSIDTRHPSISPRSGISFKTTLSVGTRNIGGRSSAIMRNEMDMIFLLPVGSMLMLVGTTGGRVAVTNVELGLLEMYPLGGTATVRGFADGEFRARRVGWFRFEPSLSVGGGRMFPFLDVGISESNSLWRLISGYGFGLRVATRAGTVGVDYGVPFGEAVAMGRVHLSFATAF